MQAASVQLDRQESHFGTSKTMPQLTYPDPNCIKALTGLQAPMSPARRANVLLQAALSLLLCAAARAAPLQFTLSCTSCQVVHNPANYSVLNMESVAGETFSEGTCLTAANLANRQACNMAFKGFVLSLAKQSTTAVSLLHRVSAGSYWALLDPCLLTCTIMSLPT